MAESLNMPSGFGGLMRFSEEYTSKYNLKPMHVVVFIISIIVFRIALSMFIK